jgi:hypothetical protein
MNETIKALYIIILGKRISGDFLTSVTDNIISMERNIDFLIDMHSYHGVPYDFPIQNLSSVEKAKNIFMNSYANMRKIDPFVVKGMMNSVLVRKMK